MRPDANQLAGCKREVEDCRRLLESNLTPVDRAATLRRLKEAENQLRELEDEALISLIE